jgi:hypothetical protein
MLDSVRSEKVARIERQRNPRAYREDAPGFASLNPGYACCAWYGQRAARGVVRGKTNPGWRFAHPGHAR